MNNLQYSKILRNNWEVIALMIGVAIVFALVISLLQPFQYSASTQILIIQKQEKNLDAYTATKSAERIGKNLTNIVYTSSFYNEVIESNSAFSKIFPQENLKRRKTWKENVKVKVIPETGILQIDVYDSDRNVASQLVKTLTYVLVSKGSEYHGGGTDVTIKLVDDVYISKYPVRPNVLVNGALAVIIGLLLGSVLVILTEASKANKLKEQLILNRNESVIDNYTSEESKNDNSNFGFVPEPQLELAAEPVLDETRPVEIITMYDHLK